MPDNRYEIYHQALLSLIDFKKLIVFQFKPAFVGIYDRQIKEIFNQLEHTTELKELSIWMKCNENLGDIICDLNHTIANNKKLTVLRIVNESLNMIDRTLYSQSMKLILERPLEQLAFRILPKSMNVFSDFIKVNSNLNMCALSFGLTLRDDNAKLFLRLVDKFICNFKKIDYLFVTFLTKNQLNNNFRDELEKRRKRFKILQYT